MPSAALRPLRVTAWTGESTSVAGEVRDECQVRGEERRDEARETDAAAARRHSRPLRRSAVRRSRRAVCHAHLRSTRVRRSLPIVLAAVLWAAVPAAAAGASPAVRIVFGGDVMLGRGVARLASASPAAVFAGIAVHLQTADLAVANLESPLTTRPHDPARGPNALEARPAAAKLLAAAGFDALALANNHAGDAGPQTVPDTDAGAAGGRVAAARRRPDCGGGLQPGGRQRPRRADRLSLLRRHG